MVEPKYIDEVLKRVNTETTRRGSCRMEENWATFKCSDTWWARLHDWARLKCFDTRWAKLKLRFLNHVFHDMYTTRCVLCYKVLYQDNSYDVWTTVGKILKYFWEKLRMCSNVKPYVVMCYTNGFDMYTNKLYLN